VVIASARWRHRWTPIEVHRWPVAHRRSAIRVTVRCGSVVAHRLEGILGHVGGPSAHRWVIAIQTKIQLPNTLPIILNCVIGVIN